MFRKTYLLILILLLPLLLLACGERGGETTVSPSVIQGPAFILFFTDP